MWKEYSINYLKKNRASGISIVVASLISTIFLSLLCSLSYNIWIYDAEKIVLPSVLVTFFCIVVSCVCIALILIIHNAFAVSMNARIHQLGILSSVGATPGQIRTFLIQEALALSVLPIIIGCVVGTFISVGVIELVNMLAADVAGRKVAVFHFSWFIFIIEAFLAFVTVWISAWIPAQKLGRLTPLQAIKNTEEILFISKSKYTILSKIFGIYGELAENTLKVQKKTLRTATLSLTISFLGFTVMLCFLSLASISTNYTYFERYQDMWDVMVTVKNTSLAEFNMEDEIRKIQDVDNCIIYQKTEGNIKLSEDMISDELSAIGGLGAIAGESVMSDEDFYYLNAPIVILDDESFAEYAKQVGASKRIDGSIVLNRIWDSKNSNFRYKKYIPMINEKQSSLMLQSAAWIESYVEVPVLAYTQTLPVLREEYDNFTLVQFVSESLWEKINIDIKNTPENNSYIRILTSKESTLDNLNNVQKKIEGVIKSQYAIEIENRIQEKISNDNMICGYMMIIGGFSSLLALIGVANVFSYTLGFVSQRKREFIRYISIGMTHSDLKKVFLVEAVIMLLKPILITLLMTILIGLFMIKASHIKFVEFWVKAPVMPILLFMTVVIVLVLVAYYVAGRKVLQQIKDNGMNI